MAAQASGAGVTNTVKDLAYQPGAIVSRPWVGFANYETVLKDPQVRQAFGNILVFLIVNVPLTVVLSLVLAAALNAAIPFRKFFRVSYYVPYVTASVAVVGVWLFMFSSFGAADCSITR